MNVEKPIYIASSVKSESELKQAMAVRHNVFVEEQGIDEREEYDGLDDSSLQFVVKTAGEIIGTARVRFITGDCAKIERMAILKPFRKHGAGKALLTFILVHVETSQVILHAQWAAIPFYKACGFKESNGSFFEAGIKHVKMVKKRDISELTP
jgi:predicted GNAT family N-acyltransferase